MKLSATLVGRLVQVGSAAAAAGHGGKEAIYTEACRELGLSRSTLLKRIKEVTVSNPRKQRSDCGSTTVTREEMVMVSATLMESLRKSATKRLLSVPDAVDILRRNGEIRCDRVDAETGEIFPVSTSTIIRALRLYRLHPDQLLRPAPAVELRSLHPNHVWQIDASLCVLYYLETKKPEEAGLQIMEYDRFYKNKPANVKRIESDRVWSYEATDHFSGAIKVNYVLGAESGINLAESLLSFMVRNAFDPIHGVPYILMLDKGSANTSGPIKNFCRRMQIELMPHAVGNARATGQVENARNIIERGFESGLRFKPVASLEELNERASAWTRYYNATKTHSRHGMTRTNCWLTISEQQLRIAPPMDVCRTLLTHEPVARKVDDYLRVSFAGREWDVSAVPRVMVGESLMITYNPFNLDTVYVVDAVDGNEVLHAAPAVERGAGGFAATANVIGQDWTKPIETDADRNRTAVELATMGVATLEEAEAKRKAKALPFGGRIDPTKPVTDTELPTVLPRRGVALDVAMRTQAAERVFSLFEAAAELARLGVAMDADKNRLVASWFPDGVPESEIAGLQQRLTVRAGLKVVGG